MSYSRFPQTLPAPCFINSGTLINKDDMRRVLSDIVRVRYLHILDNRILSEGEGWLLEVFSDPHQGTIVANGSLYLNVQSFDYLRLQVVSPQETHLDLIQDNRQLRLIPLTNTEQDVEGTPRCDDSTIDWMISQALSARWDVQFDDESLSDSVSEE
ncbi:MAG: hypothetical protein AAGG02_20530 [Cyanobacteria bacterium P01_H01_bin.15]